MVTYYFNKNIGKRKKKLENRIFHISKCLPLLCMSIRAYTVRIYI